MQPIIPAPGPNGPWRVLILDRDPADRNGSWPLSPPRTRYGPLTPMPPWTR